MNFLLNCGFSSKVSWLAGEYQSILQAKKCIATILIGLCHFRGCSIPGSEIAGLVSRMASTTPRSTQQRLRRPAAAGGGWVVAGMW